MMRLERRRLRRGSAESRIHSPLELGNRVAIASINVRSTIIRVLLAEVDEPRGIGDLLTGSSVFDEINNVLLNLAILQRESDFLTRLEPS